MRLGVTRGTGGIYVFHYYTHTVSFHYGISEIKVAEQRGHGTDISQVRSISIGHPISISGTLGTLSREPRLKRVGECSLEKFLMCERCGG